MNTIAHNIRLYVILFSGDEVILIAYYLQEITMTKYKIKSNEILISVLQTVQKKQQFTYRQYIFTDCTEDNVQNTPTYTQYT